MNPATPEIWTQFMNLFSGTPFQGFIESLQGMGFFGTVLAVVIIMVLCVVVFGAIAFVAKSIIKLFKRSHRGYAE